VDLTELAASVERVSRHYAATFGIERTSDWQILKLHEEVGELTQVHLMREGQARPKGHTRAELDERLADEIADVLCHALLLAAHHGVDLPTAIRRKWLKRIGPVDDREFG
jgi:NTP pyrophosphatase (non-canonical NTP hydrolase)